MASPVILGTLAAGTVAYWGFFKRGEVQRLHDLQCIAQFTDQLCSIF